MANLEIRKQETTVGETGAGGDRTDTTYVLGGEVDGVFIPFVSKSAGYIEHQVQREKTRQAEEQKANPPADTGEPTSSQS